MRKLMAVASVLVVALAGCTSSTPEPFVTHTSSGKVWEPVRTTIQQQGLTARWSSDGTSLDIIVSGGPNCFPTPTGYVVTAPDRLTVVTESPRPFACDLALFTKQFRTATPEGLDPSVPIEILRDYEPTPAPRTLDPADR
ncbi:hypothetical protein ACEXQD_08805 [Herbiconiux sp. P15]|uniref:hypothetical protein n=1 Tax=Herbiconiux liukaitaii TaxID=3342799 RepID=UPI0035B88A5A